MMSMVPLISVGMNTGEKRCPRCAKESKTPKSNGTTRSQKKKDRPKQSELGSRQLVVENISGTHLQPYQCCGQHAAIKRSSRALFLAPSITGRGTHHDSLRLVHYFLVPWIHRTAVNGFNLSPHRVAATGVTAEFRLLR